MFVNLISEGVLTPCFDWNELSDRGKSHMMYQFIGTWLFSRHINTSIYTTERNLSNTSHWGVQKYKLSLGTIFIRYRNYLLQYLRLKGWFHPNEIYSDAQSIHERIIPGVLKFLPLHQCTYDSKGKCRDTWVTTEYFYPVFRRARNHYNKQPPDHEVQEYRVTQNIPIKRYE